MYYLDTKIKKKATCMKCKHVKRHPREYSIFMCPKYIKFVEYSEDISECEYYEIRED